MPPTPSLVRADSESLQASSAGFGGLALDRVRGNTDRQQTPITGIMRVRSGGQTPQVADMPGFMTPSGDETSSLPATPMGRGDEKDNLATPGSQASAVGKVRNWRGAVASPSRIGSRHGLANQPSAFSRAQDRREAEDEFAAEEELESRLRLVQSVVARHESRNSSN